MDRKPAIINGATPGERRLQLLTHLSGPVTDSVCWFLSPKAAGVGLNIVAANHVIHLSRWWTQRLRINAMIVCIA